MKKLLPLLLIAVPALSQEWPQWAANAQHTERVAAFGQSPDINIENIVYDELVNQQIFATGSLLVHYQTPLVDGNDVYMMSKTGHFTATSFATQNWSETKYTWQNGSLVKVWDFATDWKAIGNTSNFFEPVFHPALSGGFLYVPGAGGTVFKVDKQTGVGTRINPFVTSVDPNTYTISPLTVDATGRVLYNVMQIAPNTEVFARDLVDSWLVRVAPNDASEKVSYSVLTAGAPLGGDLCQDAFTIEPLPWPPSPTAVPRSITCGTQRPGINISPAIAPDGTIYMVTRAHLASREAFLVAITPALQKKWMSTLRNRFNDGCGVPVSQGGALPPNGANGGCRTGANLGVDPATNTPGGGRVNDSGSSTPVVAPDGSIFYGAFTRYNYLQGHLMHFAADGSYLGAYRFGWDVTPAIYQHDGTYSIITKDNRYNAGSYCGDAALCGVDRTATNPEYPEGYFVTQLSKDLKVEWSFQNTQTENCTRLNNGTIRCTPSSEEHGYEWCVNAFVVDARGVVYANSEDGFLYAIDQSGRLKDRIFQQLALGAAYTPTSMDSFGRIYSQNAGHLFVVTGERRRAAPHR
jgi:hypothetical protein